MIASADPPWGLDYVELYVADGPGTVDHFVSSFGFVAVAVANPDTGRRDRESTVLRSGTAQLVVTTPRAAGGEVADHLERHGDGVADVALSCTDVAGVFARAVGGGAEALAPPAAVVDGGPLVARLAGFGSTTHTLVSRRPGTVGLPPGPYAELPAAQGRHDAPVDIDHLAVCLPAGTLRETAESYRTRFGLQAISSEYIELGGQAMDSIVVRSPSGGVTFTLIEPDAAAEPGQIDDFLTAYDGAGVQHVAFTVADITASVRGMRDRDVRFLATPAAYYDALEVRIGHLAEIAALRDTGVLVDRDEWGHLLQIFTRSPFPRRTLFFELIQRRGARGFGAANIRALYEAVERERAASASPLAASGE